MHCNELARKRQSSSPLLNHVKHFNDFSRDSVRCFSFWNGHLLQLRFPLWLRDELLSGPLFSVFDHFPRLRGGVEQEFCKAADGPTM